MSVFTLRKAELGDATKVSSLIQRTAITSNSPDYSDEKITFIISNSTNEKIKENIASQTVFVAFCDGILVGTASYALGKLCTLFVAPESQRLGIGSLLLHRIEDFAKAQGDIGLSVYASITAKAFYERRGFGVIGDVEMGGGIVFFMRKRLHMQFSTLSPQGLP